MSTEKRLREIIADLRQKHKESELMSFSNTQAEASYRERIREEFEVAAWNHLPHLLDELEKRLGPAGKGWPLGATTHTP